MKIPDKYLQKKWDNKDKYGNAPIVLPTKLPAEDQHTHNLSQLIQALLKPAAYEDTYNRHSYYALGGFSPQYNGRLFVERVANFWDEPTANGYTVWQILFNRTREQMKEFTELDFFNQGYSWGLFDGNKATIYYYQSKDYRTSYKSIRKMTFDVTRGFDVRAFAGDPEASSTMAYPIQALPRSLAAGSSATPRARTWQAPFSRPRLTSRCPTPQTSMFTTR